MLSVKGIRQGQDTQYYFEKDNNYYFKEDQAHLINAFEWEGKGAKALGLSGQVLPEDFKRVMDGILPDGQQLGLKQGDTIKHRPGFDLTFSAPKSVSILALVAGDDRLLVLHQKAVSVALEVVERLAQARVKKDGVMTYESTRNLVAAKFIHDTSREGDPQLHTHVVVANMTQRQDGTWRSLASDLSRQNGFFERVMNDHTYIGMIYRAELAKGLTELGFECEIVNKHGMFEIKGVPQDVREMFSKRRDQIENSMKGKYGQTLNAYDVATQNTRKSKTQTNRETLIQRWEEELKEKGWDPHAFLREVAEKVQKTKSETVLSSSELAKTIVNDTMVILSERALSMEYGTIMKRALEYGMGQCTHQDIVNAFEMGAKEKRFIPLDETKSQWTTEKLIKTEVALLDAIKTGKQTRTAIRLNEVKFEKSALSEQDKALVKNVLTTQDRIIVLNQSSEDKHIFLTHFLNTIEAQGRSVKILSPNAVHAHEVSEKVERHPESLWQRLKNLGKESVSDTVAHFNFQVAKDLQLPVYISSLKKGVVIVDAAQKMAPEAMKTLLEVTAQLKSKVILLHDVEGQTNSFQGDVMSTLKKADVRTFTREDSRNKVDFAIELHAIADDTARLKAVAGHYAHLTRDVQQNTVVVGQSVREARQLSGDIREQLRNTGQLGRMEKIITTYQPVFLSHTEKKYAKHYEAGMVLSRYHQGHNEEWHVQTVLPEENALWIKNNFGEKQYQLCKKISENTRIFEAKPLALSVGEKLMITGNMKSLGLSKGEVLTINALHTNSIEVNQSGKKITLHDHELEKSHVDYGYAESMTQLRAGKKELVITSLKSRAIEQPSMQALAKKAERIICYTNDMEKAERRFSAIPDKTTAIDKVMQAYHESSTIKKELTPDNIHHIKEGLEQAIAHLTKDALKTPVEKAVDYAIAQLSERNAGFSHQDLVKTAIGHALGKATLPEIEKILKQQAVEGSLIFGRINEKTLWTTREALTLEKEILHDIEQGKHTQTPLMDKMILSKALEKTTLNQGQKDACYLIGTTTDRFVLVQGFAGTGKSTMLGGLMKILQETSKEKPIEVIGCAPTHQAVKEMQQLGIPAQTLKSLLIEKEPSDFSNKIVLLDEVSMVSNKDFHAFQTMIQRNQGRAVYSGDFAQYLSVESGKPIEIALKKGDIATAYMTEIVRQEDPQVKAAVIDVIQGDAGAAFQKIEALPLKAIPREENLASRDWLEQLKQFEGSIIEIADEKKEDKENIHSVQPIMDGKKSKTYTLPEAVAAEYLSRPAEVRDNTVIIIQTHDERKAVHTALFDGLMQRGEISAKAIETMRLVNKGLTRVEARHCRSYKGGEYIRIGQGDYFKVTGVDHATKSLTCLKPDGTKEFIYPERISNRTPMEIYDKKEGLLSAGMRVKFTKTDKERHILANREWQVKEATSEKLIFVEKGTERAMELDPSLPQDCHWDHAYTVTGYGAQGSSHRYVIDVAVSYLKHLTSMRAFYISVSRAKQHILTFTNDKAELLSKLLKNSGDKYAALEVTGELKNKLHVPDVTQSNKAKDIASNAASKERQTVQRHEVKEISSLHTSESKKPRYEAHVIEQALRDKVALVAEHCLGEPNKNLSSSRQLRFGNKGSLVVNIQGDKQGTWHDFEEAKGGGMLNLLQEKLQFTFKEALEYGASLTGKMPENTAIILPKTSKSSHQRQEKNTIETALKLVKESLPIKGTLAEKYLNNTRQVTLNAGADLRFLPRAYTGKGNAEKQKYAPALLSIARDKSGKIQGVQATYLNQKNEDKADLHIKKRTYGALSGAVVMLQKGDEKSKETYLAEGVETGLSVANVKKEARVLVTLGKSNFNKIDSKMLTENVVFCLDNDGNNSLSKGLIEAMQRLEKAGKVVTCVIPEKAKKDLNDVLKEGGEKAVLSVLNQPLTKENLNQSHEISSLKTSEHRVNFVANKESLLDNISSLNQAEKALFQNSQSLNKSPLKSHETIVHMIKKELEREI